MVVELFDAALMGVEGAFLTHGGTPASGRRGATAPMGGVPILGAAVTGAAVGLFSSDQRSAAIGSALAGAAMPFFSRHRATLGSIAMSAITSTAIGVVAQGAKSTWVQREDSRESAPAILRG